MEIMKPHDPFHELREKEVQCSLAEGVTLVCSWALHPTDL